MKKFTLGKPPFSVFARRIFEFGRRRKPAQGNGGAGPAPVWILATGAWNDAGTWNDTASWKDR